MPRTAARLPRVQRRPRPMLAKPGFSLRGKLRFTLLVTTLFGFLMARTYPDQLRTWLTEQPVLSRLTLLAGLITPGLLVALLHRRRDWELP